MELEKGRIVGVYELAVIPSIALAAEIQGNGGHGLCCGCHYFEVISGDEMNVTIRNS